MIVRFAPLLLLVGCNAAQAENPEVSFRQCVLKQARTLNAAPDFHLAQQLGESCFEHLKSLPPVKQKQLLLDYTCALSENRPPCLPITD